MVAVRYNADMFVSIHSDATSTSRPKGVTVFDSVSLSNEDIGAKIGIAIADANGTSFRGTKERPSTIDPNDDYYTVIEVAENGGVKIVLLIERGFHTNLSDLFALMDDEKIDLSAKAMADVIIEHFRKKR